MDMKSGAGSCIVGLLLAPPAQGQTCQGQQDQRCCGGLGNNLVVQVQSCSAFIPCDGIACRQSLDRKLISIPFHGRKLRFIQGHYQVLTFGKGIDADKLRQIAF